MSYNPTSCPVLTMVRVDSKWRILLRTDFFWRVLNTSCHFLALAQHYLSFLSRKFQSASTFVSLRQKTPRSDSW